MFRLKMLKKSKTSSITSKTVKSLTLSALVLLLFLSLRKMVDLPVTVAKANNGVVHKVDMEVEAKVATETKVDMDNSVVATDSNNSPPMVAINNRHMVVDNQATP